jgi:hypothetical protein
MYESGGEGVGFRGWQLSGRGSTHSSVADQSLPETSFPPEKGIHAKEGCHVQPPVYTAEVLALVFLALVPPAPCRRRFAADVIAGMNGEGATIHVCQDALLTLPQNVALAPAAEVHVRWAWAAVSRRWIIVTLSSVSSH